MKKETYLHIADACHENWNQMTAAEQGRFCHSCCKTVTDFSTMSDKEILQILSKAASNTCGRFTSDQLERPLYQEPPVRSKPYKFFLSALIPTFLLANSGIAQKKSSNKNTKQTVSNVVMGKPARVVDCKVGEPSEKKAPIEQNWMGEVVVVSDTTIQSIASINGNDKKPVTDDMSATTDNIMMGGIQYYEKITMVDTVKTYVRKAFNQNGFKILGNPAAKGSVINIQFKNEGKYMLQFLDASGKLSYTTDATSIGKNGFTSVALPNNFVPGIYFVKATDAQKKSYTDKVNIY